MVGDLRNINNGEHSPYALLSMKQPEIQSLAEQFVIQYYTVMNQTPMSLHQFYTEESTMIHESSPSYGQKQIYEKFLEFNFKGAYVGILSLDALKAHENSLLIQVSGEMSKNHEEPRRFMQSFVLCEQSTRNFFILNDIFHYQDKVFEDKKFNSSSIMNNFVNVEAVQNADQSDFTDAIVQNGENNHSTDSWEHTVDESSHSVNNQTIMTKESDLHIKERDLNEVISPQLMQADANVIDQSQPVEDTSLTSSNSVLENISDIPTSMPVVKSWAQMASSGASQSNVAIGKVPASVQPASRSSVGRGGSMQSSNYAGVGAGAHQRVSNRDGGRPLNMGDGRRNDNINSETRFPTNAAGMTGSAENNRNGVRSGRGHGGINSSRGRGGLVTASHLGSSGQHIVNGNAVRVNAGPGSRRN